MFFEVRVFDAEGGLKKVISPKRLSNKFWKNSDNKVLTDYIDGDYGVGTPGVKPILQISDIRVEDALG